MPLDWHPYQLCYPLEIELLLFLLLLLLFWFRVSLIEKVNASAVRLKFKIGYGNCMARVLTVQN